MPKYLDNLFIKTIYYATFSKMKSKSPLKANSSKKIPFMKNKSDDVISAFAKQVYESCKNIPAGKVSTYANIATTIGNPKATRAVGSALRKNPFAPHVPCHRIVASDLSLGGFYGSKDSTGILLLKKHALLLQEGVLFTYSGNEILNQLEILDTKLLKVDISCVV